MDYKLLGKRIRDERLKLNLTQEKLAEKSSISNSFMGQVERGDRIVSLETLVRLSESLEVSVDFLLKDSVITNDNGYLNKVAVLVDGCSVKEKESILEVINIMVNLKK